MATLTFDPVAKLMTVDAPDTEITIQELHNLCVDYEDELVNLATDRIVSSAGKEPLGGGVSVGITLTLINDWQLAFEARSGPTYIQCQVSGGNLVADNVNGAIYPTAFTQVLITASSSATTSDLEAIQYGSYSNGVWIDVAGTSGTSYPIGTPETPVNNLDDAHTIAEEKGFTNFYFTSDYTFDNTVSLLDGYKFHGQSPQITTFTFESGCVLVECEFFDAELTGDETGIVGFHNCLIYNLGSVGLVPSSVDVIAKNCFFKGTVSLPSNYSGVMTAVDCWALPNGGGDPPVIDMGNSTASVQARNWSGLLTFENSTNATDIRVFLASGGVILDSSVTAGDFLISGNGTLTDNSTSVTELHIDGLVNKELITQSTWDRVYLDVDNGTSGTVFPQGTLESPVDNLTDALTIASDNNTSIIMLGGTLVLGQDVSGKEFIGWKNGKVDLNNQPCLATRFKECKVTGTQASLGLFFDCRIDDLQGMNGNYIGCYFLNTTPLVVAASANIMLNNCRSQVPGSDSPVFDLSNGGIGFNNRAYSGGIRICNSTDVGNILTSEFIAGKFNFDNTNTAGTFVVRGVVDVTNIDDSGGATVVLTGSTANLTNLDVEVSSRSNFDPSLDEVTTDTASRTASKADIATLQAQLNELYLLNGLDATKQLTVTPTSRVVGGISQTLGGDGVNVSTVKRN